MSAPDWSALRSIIDNNERFMVTSHVRPDADALGSELGMARILDAFGKQVTIVNATAPPANLQFLNRDGRILKLDEHVRRADLPEVDLHIIVDTSAWQQLGAMAEVIGKSGKPRVVIDHHVSSDNLGATDFSDVEAAATGELIFAAAEYLQVSLDTSTASALYAAIATDTGWFRFPSTTSATMRTAAALMDLGAVPHQLFNLLNEQRSLARVRLAGRVLSRVQAEADGRLTWIYADAQDLAETDAVPSDTESLVNECLTITGSEAAFIAVQLPSGEIKFSLRCRPPHNVAAVAEQMNGGGHKLASGATLPGPLSVALETVKSKFLRMLHASVAQSPNNDLPSVRQ
ncbi:MAG: bifunctional oligoribonuclease/PAP phosphatase NrnA [Planctomycetaceae bacterium]|nr:bifunctional oligoribonuclease/PAP phosphatase NrnA [Planctomycetaceae bacterium]